MSGVHEMNSPVVAFFLMGFHLVSFLLDGQYHTLSGYKVDKLQHSNLVDLQGMILPAETKADN